MDSQRLDSLRSEFPPRDLDALLVSALPNIRYLTGFTGSNGLLLIWPESAILLTDPRYAIQARAETRVRVRVVRGPLIKVALSIIKRNKLKTIGFESSRIVHDTFAALSRELPLGATLEPTQGLVEGLRMVKSPVEVDRIRQAVETNSAAFAATIGHLSPGVREYELAAELEHQMRRLGAESAAFETIALSGSNTALPHGHPSAKPLQDNELVLIDMGARRSGYTSDMTRMVFLGRPSDRVRRLYGAVLEAQLAALSVVRDGVRAEAVDRAARQVLGKHGLEKQFVHSTGHGLGLEIHEPPRLGRREKAKLKAGMVVTVEPGVYLEGFCGIRIEDTVLVTRTGCEVLTPTTKELVTV